MPELQWVKGICHLSQTMHERPAASFIFCFSDRIENLVDTGIAQWQTASLYLKQRVEIGVPEEVSSGRDERDINTRLLRELNEYEDNSPA